MSSYIEDYERRYGYWGNFVLDEPVSRCSIKKRVVLRFMTEDFVGFIGGVFTLSRLRSSCCGNFGYLVKPLFGQVRVRGKRLEKYLRGFEVCLEGQDVDFLLFALQKNSSVSVRDLYFFKELPDFCISLKVKNVYGFRSLREEELKTMFRGVKDIFLSVKT